MMLISLYFLLDNILGNISVSRKVSHCIAQRGYQAPHCGPVHAPLSTQSFQPSQLLQEFQKGTNFIRRISKIHLFVPEEIKFQAQKLSLVSTRHQRRYRYMLKLGRLSNRVLCSSSSNSSSRCNSKCSSSSLSAQLWCGGEMLCTLDRDNIWCWVN